MRICCFRYRIEFLPHCLLTPWCRVLLEKLTGLQLVKKFPAFHGTQRFITALKSVRSLYAARCFPYKHSPLPPPGDPSGGVVYLRIVLSPEESPRMWVFLNMNVLQGGVVSASPNPKAGGPPLVGCPRLLIQFIRSCPPYREADFPPLKLFNSINRIYKSQEKFTV